MRHGAHCSLGGKDILVRSQQIYDLRPLGRFFTSMLCLGALLFGGVGVASAQDMDRASQIFGLCISCHGAAGQGQQSLGAPPIAGLDAWYIEAQLQKFKTGARGAHADDYAGLMMRPMARTLTNDTDVKAVSVYVSQLKSTKSAPVLGGNASAGQAAFATCSACHGAQAQGNQSLKAPALNHQADWYVVAQLQKFKAGIRGTNKADTTGAQMRAMAMTLPDEQAMRDLAAYIATLGNN